MQHLKDNVKNDHHLHLLHHSIKPSTCYSLLSSIDKSGFFINLVPYSHLFDPIRSQFHRFQVIRVWIPPSCFILFNSRLLHGGALCSVDMDGNVLPDHRVFTYIIPSYLEQGSDDFPDHNVVYPPNDAHSCGFLNGSQGYCDICHNRGFDRDDCFVIDPTLLYHKGLSTIKTQFQGGHPIFGDLDTMGFSVVTGVKVTSPLRKKIYTLRDSFKNIHSGLTDQPGRCMVVPPSELSDALIQMESKFNGKHLFSNYLDATLDAVHKLTHKSPGFFIHYKHNIIFNRSNIPIDQKLHYDYEFDLNVRRNSKRKEETLASDVREISKRQKNSDKAGKTQTFLTNKISLKTKNNK